MSTTPIISKQAPAPYTVVGGKKQQQTGTRAPELTVMLLNREGRFYREELLKEISALPATEIIYIEGPELTYDIEPLSRQFPAVRFLLFKNPVSTGEKINLGITEAHTTFILVMWSDMKLLLLQQAGILCANAKAGKTICSIPLCRNARKEIIPTIQVPGFFRHRLKIIPWKSEKEGTRSLFPFDFCGIYHKEKFQSLGGFDEAILNPYWQKVDFGCRAFLWGERIVLDPAFSLFYSMETSAEDSSPDSGYKRFYLKNAAVTQHRGRGSLKWYKFVHYWLYSGCGPVRALNEFLQVKKWVEHSGERYKLDLKTIINLWEPPEQ